MDKFIKHFIEEKIKEKKLEDGARCVGDLPAPLRVKMRNLQIEGDHLDEELEIRKSQYSLEIRRKLIEEFDSKFEAYEKRHNEAWNEIYQELNIDPDGHYFHRHGKIYTEREDDFSSESWKPSEVDFTRPYRL